MNSDEALYRRYLAGDEQGLSELMERYGNALTLYINGYLHDVHEAEDLMIEAFAYLFLKKPTIRDDGLRAYLYKAARHMALRRKGRRQREFCMEMLPETADERALVEEMARTKERHRVLHACMAELNATYREALYLLYFEEMSYAQTGVVMGKTVRQITNIAYRGKISLRGLLEREGIMDAQS